MGIFRSPSQLLKKRKASSEAGEDKVETAASTAEATPEASADTPAPTNPLPPAPSTTELLLRSDREKSQTAYQRAQKAEAAYRAKKNAERARNDYKSSKSHIKTSCIELKLGIKTAFSSARSSPSVLKEKQHNAGSKKAVRRQEKEEEKRKRLSAKLKKVQEQKAKLDEGGENAVSEDVVADPPANGEVEKEEEAVVAAE
ncbi:hypothetical protein Slin14017_G080430 [Septoria linicola]|nr:hypothetical protein Slin14017_G080430 [Septoria linicola]